MDVIVVDDHEALRRVLGEWLQDIFPQYGFIGMATARDAISYCVDKVPKAVIMDVDMPGMNGIEATARLKTMMPDIRVVILTIHENGAYKEAALRAGANAYVAKNRLYNDLIPVLSDILEDREQRQ